LRIRTRAPARRSSWPQTTPVSSPASRIKATGKIIATQFAIILTITGDVVTRFQMLEDSFDVSAGYDRT
jgi:hypothetical protein